jgi:hypothetical protein
MSIDTGQSLSYNQNFPNPNVDQSSQQFRDNFSIIKAAIENLQTAQSDSNSLFSITTALGTAGNITVDTAYKNNALTLPIGSPSAGSPVAGMIQFNSGTSTVQFYNGAAWISLLFANAGVATFTTLTVSGLTLNFTPTAGTDAVNLSYLNTQLSPITNSITFQISEVNANASTIVNNLNAEATSRSTADINLQNQINTITAELSNTSSNAGSIPAQITTLTQNLSNEANSRASADTSQTNNINTLSNSVSNAVTLSLLVQTDLGQESTARVAGDQALNNLINTVVNRQTNDESALVLESNNRTQADSNLSNSISALNSTLANAITQEQNDITNAAATYLAKTGGFITGNLRITGNETISNGTLTIANAVNGAVLVGSNTATNANSGVELISTTSSFILSRMTTTQKMAMAAANGMVVYDTTLNKFQGYENGAWVNFSAA